MSFTLPRVELNIALNCIDNNNQRKSIICVYVHKEGYISAVDGVKAFVSRYIPELDNVLENDFCFHMTKKPAKAIESVEICPESLMAKFIKNGEAQEIVPIKSVQGQRVDYKTFVERHKPSQNSTASINPAILKLVSLFESESVNFSVGESNTPSIIRAIEGLMIIMPQNYTEIEAPELVSIPLNRAA